VIRYHARWVIPITADPIEHGTVGVDKATRRIVYVGPRALAPPGRDHPLGHVVLMPGLVNAHCHLELTVMRGFLEDLDFRRWILRLVGARRAVLTGDAMLDSARLGLEEGIRAGITTYADTSESGVVAQAMREYRVRGIMYQEVFGPDPVQCGPAMEELRAKVERHVTEETPLVRIGISPHAPYSVSNELFQAAAAYAIERRLPIAIHIAESEMESRLVVDGEGPFAEGLRARDIAVAARATSPVQLLARLGVLAARPLLIHCVRVDAADIASIAGASCAVAHCPTSNAKLGHGIAPLTEMLGAGVEVGLGSDSVASNNRMHLLDEARMALLMQRARVGSHETVSAADVLELATLGGARALGLGDEIGSLEPGKSADLAAFPLGAMTPVHDPVAAAVYALGGACATFVAVAGVPLLDGGKPVRHDADLATRAQRTADTMGEWLVAGGELGSTGFARAPT
jgi:cytosine/adenosine deaminase-related metal-dependent hydrolase